MGKGKLYSGKIVKSGKQTRGVRQMGIDLNPACDDVMDESRFCDGERWEIEDTISSCIKIDTF